MFWLFVGYVVTSFGLATLSFFSDWPGAERDAYFRNVGAAGGFFSLLGLFCILYGASQGTGEGAFLAVVLALLTGAAGSWLLRRKKRSKVRDLVATRESDPPRF